MRLFLLLLCAVSLGKAETITGQKILPGGGPATVGTVSIEGNQSFGPEYQTFRTKVFPGLHTISASSPPGFDISYSICINCITHLASSYIPGTLVSFAIPIHGSVDISWLYTPRPGIIQGTRVLYNGPVFTSASITIDALQTVAAGTSTFSSTVSSGTHSLATSVPTGYSVAYSVCNNCTLHPPSSFFSGAVATLQVPPDGYSDVQFQYTPAAASVISVVSPVANQTVSGSLTLSVTGTNLTKAASVEYTIGANRIARVPASAANPGFQSVWNSALASDGVSQIEIAARDYSDAILFQDTRTVVLNNFGNAAGAANLPVTLSASVPLNITAFDRLHFPAYWQLFLDGEILPGSTGLLFSDHDGVHQNARSTNLDTTLFPNGRHEFHFAFHSNDYPAVSTDSGGLDFRGMATQNVNLENGRSLMEILPNYLFIYTPVSTGVQLTCARGYTNGDRDSCAAPHYSLDPANSSPGLQVSATGLVTGTQEGYGDVLVTDSNRSATVHVWVRNSPGLPHFQDGGRYGTTFLPGKSIFAIAPFQLSPEQAMGDATTLSETRRAGVNTLNKGIYLPNSNTSLLFSTWKTMFDNAGYAASYSWAVQNGFRILGSGDDIARRPGFEASWLANWPAASQAVQYAMQTFAQSGAGLALDVVDESSAIWGSNPIPAGTIGSPHVFQSVVCSISTCNFAWPSLLDPLDYTFHDPLFANRSFVLTGEPALNTAVGRAATITSVVAPQVAASLLPQVFASPRTFTPATSPNLEFLWFSGAVSCPGNVTCNPPLSNKLLLNLASWLRTATPSVPISWPPAGAALPHIQKNWLQAGGVSDYASHYWDTNQQRRTYVFGMGARENQNAMLTAFLSRQSAVNLNRPQLLQQSMTGISYLKNSPVGNSSYNPPADQLAHVGQTPRAVVSGIMTAAAAGAAGVKLYKYDNTFAQRRDSLPSGIELESDAGPVTGEVLNWQAMGYASAILAKSIPDYILGQPLNSPYLGRNLISGARRGDNGNLLMVVNGWDGTRTVPLDLTAFRTGNPILRYRVADTSLKVQALPDAASDTVLLGAGETAIYVFPKTASVTGVDTVTFTPDTAGVRVMLRTNYLYSQNTVTFGDVRDCSSGCAVPVDRKVGDSYYSYAVVDSAGAAQCRSGAIAIPPGTSVTLAVGAVTRGAVCLP